MKGAFLPKKRRYDIVPSLANKTDRSKVIIQGMGTVIQIVVVLDCQERKDVSQKRGLQGVDPDGASLGIGIVMILLVLVQVSSRVGAGPVG